jgi:hypothetical protein
MSDWYVGKPPGGVPERCLATGLPFFSMERDDDGSEVPTFGGPISSFTTPFYDEDEKEWRWYRFDHDEGRWEEGSELVPMKLVRRFVPTPPQGSTEEESE